jgi:signal transduction histidine kinase
MIGLVSGAMITWLFGIALRRRAGPRTGLDPGLSDGLVLLAATGEITGASPGAGERFGEIIGKQLSDVVGGQLADGEDHARSALERLVKTGEPLHLAALARNGGSIELVGHPQGGLVRLTLRERLPGVEAGGAAAGAGGKKPVDEPSGTGVGSIADVVAKLPLAVWSRPVSGPPDWSAGGLRTDTGTPLASAAAKAATEHCPATPASDGKQRLRIELPSEPAAEPFVVDAIEVPGEGGGKLGFAIAASAALEAERTLDRVIRTMTETFAHLTAGLAIFDRNQALTMFNPALLRMWQVDAGWLARRPTLGEVLGALRTKRRIPETADFHAWCRRLTDLFKDTDAADYEELWHLADGSNILVLARPHPHGALALVFDDVTERLWLEQRYRHSIDLRLATLDRLEEGLAVFGPDGLLQLVNSAFHNIWDTDAETVRPSMHAGELLPMIRGLTVETEVWARLMTFITGEADRHAWAARLSLGSGRILSARFSALPDGSTMAVFGDVTDSERIALALRERNEALEAAQEMRGAMLDQISYRLRNPLNTIFGFGQLIGDSRFGPLTDAQRGYAEGILESARHLLASVDEVTEMAGLELGPLGDSQDESNLGDTLMLTARLLEKRTTEEGVTLRVARCDLESLPAVDVGRLRQIVFSLVTGAICRCRAGGTIELGARPGPGGTSEIFTCETLPGDRDAESVWGRRDGGYPCHPADDAARGRQLYPGARRGRGAALRCLPLRRVPDGRVIERHRPGPVTPAAVSRGRKSR